MPTEYAEEKEENVTFELEFAERVALPESVPRPIKFNRKASRSRGGTNRCQR